MPDTFHVTQHAIDRYVRRFAPGLTSAEARGAIYQQLTNATLLRAKTTHGHLQYLLQDGCIAVAKRCRRSGELVVTTMFYDLPAEGIRAEERAIVEAHAAMLRAWREQQPAHMIEEPPGIEEGRATLKQRQTLALYELQIVKEQQRTVRHLINKMGDRRRRTMRVLLSFALRRSQGGDPEAVALLASLEAEDPGILRVAEGGD